MKLLYILLTLAIVSLLLLFQPASAPAQQSCDPSYPTVCIAPPPPDLDCSDIPDRNFAVRQPDPHRFDGDRDGVGCEA